MRSIICEILPEDLGSNEAPTSAPLSMSSRAWMRWLKPQRLLMASPALIGIDQTPLDSRLATNLLQKGFLILQVRRLTKTAGAVVHRLNLALRGNEIVIRNQRIAATSGEPLAFYLPLAPQGWSVYETSQTLTLRFSSCGFLTWPVRTEDQAHDMLRAVTELTISAPQQIHHAGPVSGRSEQIAKLLSRPLVFGDLARSPDYRVQLFSARGWSGVASDGAAISTRVKDALIAPGRGFLRSALGVSLAVFLLAFGLTQWATSRPGGGLAKPKLAAASSGPRAFGTPHWEIVNRASAEISQAGLSQVREFKMRLEGPVSAQERAAQFRWALSPVPMLRAAEQKNQTLAQTKLQETLTRLPGVESTEVDLSKLVVTIKTKPLAFVADPISGDIATWIDTMKNTHAVQLQQQGSSGQRSTLKAPEQPVGNLLGLAAAISRHAELREITMSITNPGLAAMVIELEMPR